MVGTFPLFKLLQSVQKCRDGGEHSDTLARLWEYQFRLTCPALLQADPELCGVRQWHFAAVASLLSLANVVFKSVLPHTAQGQLSSMGRKGKLEGPGAGSCTGESFHMPSSQPLWLLLAFCPSLKQWR